MSLQMSVSVAFAVLSFVIVVVAVAVKCSSKIFQRKNALNEMCTHKKGQPVERRTNIYGTYRSNASLRDNFEGDASDHEDQYAVIRESQVMSMIICTDKPDDAVSHVLPLTNCSRDTDDTVEEYDIFSNYNCQEYNHLNNMGVQRIPGQQKLMENIYTTNPKRKNDLSFQDECF